MPINTGGGAGVEGDVNPNGDFVGRDVINNYTDEPVARLGYQLNRLRDENKWQHALLEQKIDTLIAIFQNYQNMSLMTSTRAPSTAPPATSTLYVLASIVIFLVLALLGLAVYWSLH